MDRQVRTGGNVKHKKVKVEADLRVYQTGAKDAWYYREKKHFDIYVHAAPGQIINFRIPYSKVPK